MRQLRCTTSCSVLYIKFDNTSFIMPLFYFMKFMLYFEIKCFCSKILTSLLQICTVLMFNFTCSITVSFTVYSRLWFWHQLYVWSRALRASVAVCYLILLRIMITRSSAYLCTSYPLLVKFVMRLLTTRHQNKDDKTSPWRQPLLTLTVVVSEPSIALPCRPTSMALIHSVVDGKNLWQK